MSLQINQSNNYYLNTQNRYNQEMNRTSMPSVANLSKADNNVLTTKAQASSKSMKLGDYECETCKNRKYVDGSDDPGVSFKTPTRVSPESAASQVLAHEREHVSRESSKADAEGKKVVSQSISLHTAICSECGKPYIAGGVTLTTTKSENKQNDNNFGRFLDTYI